MERLDFVSSMAVLRRNIQDESFENQADYLHSLFIDVNILPQYEKKFDQGRVCR